MAHPVPENRARIDRAKPHFTLTPRSIAAPALLASVWISGCDRSPTMPSPVVADRVAAASLAVGAFAIRPFGDGNRQDGHYSYDPSLTLRETSGRSDARIDRVTFTLPDGNRTVMDAAGCLNTSAPAVVPSGGQWDISSAYLYCRELDTREPLEGSQVIAISVHFKDRNGVAGLMEATVEVPAQ